MKAFHEFNDAQLYKDYLRNYYAGQALQGLMALQNKGEFDNLEEAYKKLSEHAVMASDALLTELSKP